MATIRPQVLAQIKRGPKSPEQLLKAIDEIENEKQLANCLYNLRKAGEVRRLDDGRYELGFEKGFAVTRSTVGAHETPRKPRDPIVDEMRAAPAFAPVAKVPAAPAQSAAATKPDPALREYRDDLEAAAVKTQDALDEYLASVADPKILKPLRAARDATRAALKAFDASQAARP